MGRQITAGKYHAILIGTLTALSVIVITGAAVRLSDSGLGCEDWPKCNSDKFVPQWEAHAWIEFGNRLLSGVVAAAVIAAVMFSYRRAPRDRRLIKWAWGLAVGVTTQVVLGGVTVLADLHPGVVGLHYLLSALLIWNTVVLIMINCSGQPSRYGLANRTIPLRVKLLPAAATAVLISGVIVTGTGPNSGDSRAERFGFVLSEVARIHGVFVWLFVATIVWILLKQQSAEGLKALMVLIVAQAALGYVQYSLGLDPRLVALHVTGSVLVWIATLYTYYKLCDRHRLELS